MSRWNGDPRSEICITYNPQYREGINKDRLSALRAQYPEIYDEFVDQTELRIFKVVKTAIA